MSNAATLWKLVNFCICLACIIKYSWWTPCKRQKCKKWLKNLFHPLTYPSGSVWPCWMRMHQFRGSATSISDGTFSKNILTIQKHYDNLPKIALVSIILVQRKPDLHSERHLLTGKISVRDRLPICCKIWNFTYFNVKIFEIFE